MANQLTCIVTGETLVRTPQALAEQIKKFGFKNEEDLRSQYLGRSARKLLKEGQSVYDIRSAYGCTITSEVLPETLIRFKVRKIKHD